MLDWLGSLAYLFTQPAFILALCAGIIALTFVPIFSGRLAAGELKRDIGSAQAMLEAGANEPKDLSARALAGPRTRLTLVLEELAGALIAYRGRIYRPASFPLAERFVRAADAYADLRSLEAWPNVLIGIGLFLTFVGLTLSLIVAAQGTTSSDIDVVRRSVGDLLHFAAFKFATSLVALACSILLGFFQRGLRARTYRRLEALIAAAEARYAPLYLEALAAEVASTLRSSPV